MKNKTIKVDYLARVEGEGSLFVKIKDDKVSEVRFGIFEPPRFFEAFLRGRNYTEAPDITARICGICPIAYQMSAVHAMENAFDVKVEGQLRELRRLIYCGEWIESHTLHVYMLHAPDFLGYPDAIHLAKDHPEIVEKALKLKKIGNELVTLIGGREIHPVNVKVGGFYRVPYKKELKDIEEKLKWARDASIETAKLVSTFTFPDFERDYEYVALCHEKEYPFNEGRLKSNKGLDISISDYDKYFVEDHVKHSNALQSKIRERGAYHVGPLARYNLNFDKLPKIVKETANEIGIGRTVNNPFKSIIVRSLEILFACEEALRIIKQYERPDKPSVKIEPESATGYGCSEAPRGICYHRYRVDNEGIIRDARIIPPTSQNQKTIEQDLWEFVPPRINLPQDELTWQCEQAIRNYDPCISCATHFLNLKIEKED
ncbi:MAG: Ni/Fe hydrogenase subunit alpha [Ignavibacteria bacterium]